MRGGWQALFSMLLCLFSATAWTGQEKIPAGLAARLDPEEARVGSAVTLILDYNLPTGARLEANTPIGGLEGLTVLERRTGPGQIRVRLLVDRIGRFRTGPLTLAYVDGEGKKGELKTGPVELKVLSNLGKKPGEAKLRPILGIIPTVSFLRKYLPWLMALPLVLAGCGAIFFWIRRRRNRAAPGVAGDAPHVAARRSIHELQSLGLFEKGRVKEFYFRFSWIMKRYLEALRGFPAAEYTTNEIARAIKEPGDRRLLALLEHADLVKFADLRPMGARKDEDVGEALSYIDETCSAFEDPRSAGTAGDGGAVTSAGAAGEGKG